MDFERQQRMISSAVITVDRDLSNWSTNNELLQKREMTAEEAQQRRFDILKRAEKLWETMPIDPETQMSMHGYTVEGDEWAVWPCSPWFDPHKVEIDGKEYEIVTRLVKEYERSDVPASLDIQTMAIHGQDDPIVHKHFTIPVGEKYVQIFDDHFHGDFIIHAVNEDGTHAAGHLLNPGVMNWDDLEATIAIAEAEFGLVPQA